LHGCRLKSAKPSYLQRISARRVRLSQNTPQKQISGSMGYQYSIITVRFVAVQSSLFSRVCQVTSARRSGQLPPALEAGLRSTDMRHHYNTATGEALTCSIMAPLLRDVLAMCRLPFGVSRAPLAEPAWRCAGRFISPSNTCCQWSDHFTVGTRPLLGGCTLGGHLQLLQPCFWTCITCCSKRDSSCGAVLLLEP